MKLQIHILAALSSAALVAAETDLVWPFGLGVTTSGWLAGEGSDTITLQIAQFPSPSQVAGPSYGKLTVKVQCTSGCGFVGPCLTVSSSQSGSTRACSSDIHTIEDLMPISYSSEQTYLLTVANTAHTDSITYSITIEQVCASTGLPVDANACFPVLTGPFPEACVYATTGNNARFAVGGCSCALPLDAYGCSNCWDGSWSGDNVDQNNIQQCGSCPAAPSPSSSPLPPSATSTYVPPSATSTYVPPSDSSTPSVTPTASTSFVPPSPSSSPAASSAPPSPFTAGNVLVARVAAAAPNNIFLDQFTPTGTWANSMQLPITGQLTDNTQNFASLSGDGRLVMVTGSGSQFAVVQASGAVSVHTDANQETIASVCSVDGSSYFLTILSSTNTNGQLRVLPAGEQTSQAVDGSQSYISCMMTAAGELYASTWSGQVIYYASPPAAGAGTGAVLQGISSPYMRSVALVAVQGELQVVAMGNSGAEWCTGTPTSVYNCHQVVPWSWNGSPIATAGSTNAAVAVAASDNSVFVVSTVTGEFTTANSLVDGSRYSGVAGVPVTPQPPAPAPADFALGALTGVAAIGVLVGGGVVFIAIVVAVGVTIACVCCKPPARKYAGGAGVQDWGRGMTVAVMPNPLQAIELTVAPSTTAGADDAAAASA